MYRSGDTKDPSESLSYRHSQSLQLILPEAVCEGEVLSVAEHEREAEGGVFVDEGDELVHLGARVLARGCVVRAVKRIKLREQGLELVEVLILGLGGEARDRGDLFQ